MTPSTERSFWKLRLLDYRSHIGWMVVLVGSGIGILTSLTTAGILIFQLFAWLSSEVWITASLEDALKWLDIEMTWQSAAVVRPSLARIVRWFLALHVGLYLLLFLVPLAAAIFGAGSTLHKRAPQGS